MFCDGYFTPGMFAPRYFYRTRSLAARVGLFGGKLFIQAWGTLFD